MDDKTGDLRRHDDQKNHKEQSGSPFKVLHRRKALDNHSL